MLIFHKINNLISQLSDKMTLEPLDSSHVSCGIIVRIDVHRSKAAKREVSRENTEQRGETLC